jgi:hypothetical protein
MSTKLGKCASSLRPDELELHRSPGRQRQGLRRLCRAASALARGGGGRCKSATSTPLLLHALLSRPAPPTRLQCGSVRHGTWQPVGLARLIADYPVSPSPAPVHRAAAGEICLPSIRFRNGMVPSNSISLSLSDLFTDVPQIDLVLDHRSTHACGRLF